MVTSTPGSSGSDAACGGKDAINVLFAVQCAKTGASEATVTFEEELIYSMQRVPMRTIIEVNIAGIGVLLFQYYNVN